MSVSLARPHLKARILAGDTPDWVLKHIRSQYIMQVALSTPPWVDKQALKKLQQRARDMTLATGQLHVVDHIVPVTHPLVCGLSVPWNMQVVHWRVNASKGNYWNDGSQSDLFELTGQGALI